ncbi:hypothetical protein ACBI01_001152 [Aeromonas veronii]
MSFFGAIGSAIGSVCSGLGSALGSMGGALARGISSALSVVGPLLGPGLSAVSKIAQVLFHAVGIFKEQETPEKIGRQVIKGAEEGIHPEAYARYEEYLDAIRGVTITDVDRQKIDKNTATVTGVFVGCRTIEDKFELKEGSGESLMKLMFIAPDYFSSSRLEQVIKAGGYINDIMKYFDNKLVPSKSQMVLDDLFSIEKTLNPDANQTLHDQKIDKIESNYQQQKNHA